MSTTDISFKARVRIGDEIIPLASEIVVGDSRSRDGVENGFLFKLDLGPNDPPVQINLGAVIGFIEEKLGAGKGSLQNNSGVGTLAQVFPAQVSSTNFDSSNGAIVEIRNFVINSTTRQFLFQISADVVGSDPAKGLIPLPAALSNWLRIDQLSISFSATTKKA